MIRREFVEEYLQYIILQYYDKPKAKRTIEGIAESFSKIFDLMDTIPLFYDLDTAQGLQLDQLGKIAGIGRLVPDAVPKVYFAFDGYAAAKGFGDRFDVSISGGTFSNRFSPSRTPLELDDNDYRVIIKLQIAKNIASGYLISKTDRLGLQELITTAFDGKATVYDRLNMSLAMYISPDLSLELVQNIIKMDLLPRPQGVNFLYIAAGDVSEGLFSFAGGSGKGFGDRFDSSIKGGLFASKIIV